MSPAIRWRTVSGRKVELKATEGCSEPGTSMMCQSPWENKLLLQRSKSSEYKTRRGTCKYCFKQLSFYRLRKHLQTVHGDSVAAVAKKVHARNQTVPCLVPSCTYKGSNEEALKRHLRRKHPDAKHVEVPKWPCPLCDSKVANQLALNEHCKTKHGKPCDVETESFATESEFEAWKEEMEQRYVTKWTSMSSHTKRKHPIKHYVCHRAGVVRHCGNGIRESRNSIKSTRHCTSFLKMEISADGSVLARYCLVHVGHSVTASKLPLSTEDKRVIGSYLDLGFDVKTILKVVHKVYNDPNERLFWLSAADIRNTREYLSHHRLESHQSGSDSPVKAIVERRKLRSLNVPSSVAQEDTVKLQEFLSRYSHVGTVEELMRMVANSFPKLDIQQDDHWAELKKFMDKQEKRAMRKNGEVKKETLIPEEVEKESHREEVTAAEVLEEEICTDDIVELEEENEQAVAVISKEDEVPVPISEPQNRPLAELVPSPRVEVTRLRKAINEYANNICCMVSKIENGNVEEHLSKLRRVTWKLWDIIATEFDVNALEDASPLNDAVDSGSQTNPTTNGKENQSVANSRKRVSK